MIFVVVLLGLFLAILTILRRSRGTRSVASTAAAHGCNPISKYPHIDPILGLDFSLLTWKNFRKGEFSEGIRRQHEALGRTFMVNSLGQSCIYTIEPANILTITTEKFHDYGKSSWVNEASKHIGSGILMSDGEAWKQSRLRLRPIFSKMALDEIELVEPHLQRLLRIISDIKGTPFNFQELSGRLILDIVTDFLFGNSTKSLTNEAKSTDGRQFLSLVKEFEPPAGTFVAVGAPAWLEILPSYRRILRVVDGMKGFFKQRLDAILRGEASNSNGTSCFRMMTSDGIHQDQIQAELQNIFFASFDTTNALLANLVDVLSRRPDIMAQLRREIKPLNGRYPTKKDIGQFCYLKFVILEALRLYTPVASHSRVAKRDTVLPRGGGADGNSPAFVASGTTIIWSVYSLNRDASYYGTDWADFRPERWQSLERSSRNFFMPFGSGPRACMGREMAQMEVSYILVRILQEFATLKCEDSRPFEEAKAVSFYNEHGTLVSIR